MWFLIGGLVLLALWTAGIDPVSSWHWGWILLPFGLAAAWWAFADATGLTRRRAERKMDERKVARRERDMAALGLTIRRAAPGRKSGSRAAPAPSKPADSPRREPRP